MKLGKIIVFPIKSLDGVSIETARVTAGGILENDRVYAIYDAEGKIVNGKRTGRVHQLRCTFDDAIREVCLRQDGDSSQTRFSLDDCARISGWLTTFFDLRVFLRHEPLGGFPDDLKASGPTIVSDASLRAVQRWFPGVTVESIRRRFRANLELTGGEPFCEDRLFGAAGEFKTFQIGPVRFLGHNPCQRCVVPTRDPDTAEAVVDFQKKFMHLRREHLPAWSNVERFNHFYRFAVNTSIPETETGKMLRNGDTVRA